MVSVKQPRLERQSGVQGHRRQRLLILGVFLWGILGASWVVLEAAENTRLEREGKGRGKADSGCPSTFPLENSFCLGKLV